MVFYGVQDVRGVRGGGVVIRQRLRSGFIRGRSSELILCCFLSKQRDQNKEGGCTMDGGCVYAAETVCKMQLLRVENNI